MARGHATYIDGEILKIVFWISYENELSAHFFSKLNKEQRLSQSFHIVHNSVKCLNIQNRDKLASNEGDQVGFWYM